MQTWIIVLIFDSIVLSVGPLPMDSAECEAFAEERSAAISEAFDANNLKNDPRMQLDGRRITRDDIKVICEVAPSRPQ